MQNLFTDNIFFKPVFYAKMVFFIPGTDSKIFQGAWRVFTFHIEIFSLLSEPTANSVMKRSKCEKWKLFKPLEKFKRKGLGWVICFLRLIEIYLYAIIISTYQEKFTESWKNLYRTSTDRIFSFHRLYESLDFGFWGNNPMTWKSHEDVWIWFFPLLCSLSFWWSS